MRVGNFELERGGIGSKAPEKTGVHPKRDKASPPIPLLQRSSRGGEGGFVAGRGVTQDGARSSLGLRYFRFILSGFWVGAGWDRAGRTTGETLNVEP